MYFCGISLCVFVVNYCVFLRQHYTFQCTANTYKHKKKDTLSDVLCVLFRDSSFGNEWFKLFCDAKWWTITSSLSPPQPSCGGGPIEGFSSIWENEKGIPFRISLCVLPGTRTLDPLIRVSCSTNWARKTWFVSKPSAKVLQKMQIRKFFYKKMYFYAFFCIFR